MSAIKPQTDMGVPVEKSVPQVPPELGETQPLPWEQIENGRYMPRRIRGSYLGRELG